MASFLYVLILFCLTATCRSSTVELSWDTYTPIQVDSTSQLVHFTTTATEQFVFDYETVRFILPNSQNHRMATVRDFLLC